MLRPNLRGLGQSLWGMGAPADTYIVTPGVNEARWFSEYSAGRYRDQEAYVKAANAPVGNAALSYDTVARLFGPYAVLVQYSGTPVWYLGSAYEPQLGGAARRFRPMGASFQQDGFNLATPAGVVRVPRWIYSPSTPISDLAQLAVQSTNEERLGVARNCGGALGIVTRTQAQALIARGVSNACIEEVARLPALPPSGPAAFLPPEGPPTGVMPVPVPPPPTGVPPAPTGPCSAGFSPPPCSAGSHAAAADASGCVRCEPDTTGPTKAGMLMGAGLLAGLAALIYAATRPKEASP